LNSHAKELKKEKSSKKELEQCLQLIRKVDTGKSFNLSNAVEENGITLNRDISNHLTYHIWNLKIKYNFYSNKLAELQKGNFQTESTVINLQGVMIIIACSCLIHTNGINDFIDNK
jgi:hypothetical protein